MTVITRIRRSAVYKLVSLWNVLDWQTGMFESLELNGQSLTPHQTQSTSFRRRSSQPMKQTMQNYSKTKLPRFSRLSRHSARKRGGLILQCYRAPRRGNWIQLSDPESVCKVNWAVYQTAIQNSTFQLFMATKNRQSIRWNSAARFMYELQ